jgi:hypothetical protein
MIMVDLSVPALVKVLEGPHNPDIESSSSIDAAELVNFNHTALDSKFRRLSLDFAVSRVPHEEAKPRSPSACGVVSSGGPGR